MNDRGKNCYLCGKRFTHRDIKDSMLLDLKERRVHMLCRLGQEKLQREIQKGNWY